MEFCEGGKVNDREYMKQHKISVDEVCMINKLPTVVTKLKRIHHIGF
jgi:hypothetical protein